MASRSRGKTSQLEHDSYWDPFGCWGQKKRKVWLRVRNQGALSVQLSNGPTRRARAARQLVGTRLTSFASLTIAATSSR